MAQVDKYTREGILGEKSDEAEGERVRERVLLQVTQTRRHEMKRQTEG